MKNYDYNSCIDNTSCNSWIFNREDSMTNCQLMEKRIREECKSRGIDSEASIRYIIATALWETNHTCLPVKEAYWLSEEWRKKHLRYYPYYGRGYVQLTWEANYEKFGKILGVDLVHKPDLALDPELAIKILVEGMERGLFTGYSLANFFSGEIADYRYARKIINGMDKADTIASMAQNIHIA